MIMSFFYGLKKAVLDASGKEYRLNCLVAAGAITRSFQRAFRILSVQRELRESLKVDLYIDTIPITIITKLIIES